MKRSPFTEPTNRAAPPIAERNRKLAAAGHAYVGAGMERLTQWREDSNRSLTRHQQGNQNKIKRPHE